MMKSPEPTQSDSLAPEAKARYAAIVLGATGNVGGRIVDFLDSLIGHFKGGLLQVMVVGVYLSSCISGSTTMPPSLAISTSWPPTASPVSLSPGPAR